MNYQPMYFALFNAITDALDALEENDVLQARELLILAQQRGEELYMQQEEKDGQSG